VTTPDNEVGARLILQGRAEYSREATTAAEDTSRIGSAAEQAGAKAEAGSKGFTTLGQRVKGSLGMINAKEFGVKGGMAGTALAEGFYRDSNGKMRDASGMFVKTGNSVGNNIRLGAEEELSRMTSGGGVLSKMGRGFTSAGVGAGRRFGTSMRETAGSYIKTIGATMAGFFAYEKVKETITGAITAANELVKVQRGTAAALKSTHDASGQTSAGIAELADHMEAMTGQSKVANQGMLNMLLTFPKIKNNNFAFAAKDAANLAARMGTSLPSAARVMGRAVNDPVKGLTALSRVGIRFSDSQTKTINSLVATGNTAKAQAIILNAVNSRVGGAAKAAVTPTERLHVAWDNFELMIGGKLLPVINKLDDWFAKKGIPDLIKFGRWVDNNKGTIKALGLVLLTLIGAWKTYRGVMLLAAAASAVMEGDMVALDAVMDANPISMVVIGIAALAAGFIYAYKHSQTFRTIAQGAFHAVAAAVDFVKSHWKLFVTGFALLAGGPFLAAIVLILTHFKTFKKVVTDVFHAVVDSAEATWHGISDAFSAVIGWVRKHWPIVLGILTGPFGLAVGEIIHHFGAIETFFGNLPGYLKKALSTVGGFLLAPFKWAFNNIAKIWNDTVGKLSFHLPHWIPHIGGDGFSMPQIPQMAAGGTVQGGRMYRIGERGMETYVPAIDGRILSHADTMAAAARSPVVAGRAAVVSGANVQTTSQALAAQTVAEGGGDGPVVIQLVVDRKVLAEATYQHTKDKAARR
jgi:hypothetical protein